MKQFRLLMLTTVVIAALTMPVLAHPGRTDANGGHTDHSTGEYHYHHGYSAHQHWDMDGDGDLDCPYQFNNPSQSNDSHTGKTSTYKPTSKPSNSSTQKSKNDGLLGVLKVLGEFVLLFIFCYAIYGIFFLYIKIKEAIQQHRYKKAQEKEKQKSEDNSENEKKGNDDNASFTLIVAILAPLLALIIILAISTIAKY